MEGNREKENRDINQLTQSIEDVSDNLLVRDENERLFIVGSLDKIAKTSNK